MTLILPLRTNVASYGTCTTSVGTGTVNGTVQSLLYLWHTATNTKRIEITRVVATFGG